MIPSTYPAAFSSLSTLRPLLPLHSTHLSSLFSQIESKWSYFKCDHSRHHFVVHSVRGHVPLKIVHFIMNMRTDCHPFYLSRHGQSEYNQIGRIGGDSGLTEHGLAYARKLADFVESHIVRGDVCGAARSPGAAATSGSGNGNGSAAGGGVVNGRGDEIPARLWTSTLRRTRETAQFIGQRTLFIRDKDDPSLEFEWVQVRTYVHAVMTLLTPWGNIPLGRDFSLVTCSLFFYCPY